jgi:hypothetical protein
MKIDLFEEVNNDKRDFIRRDYQKKTVFEQIFKSCIDTIQ